MSSNTTDSSIGSQIRSGIKGIHGMGEAIRGTTLSEVDKAFGTSGTTESAKNEAIAQKGIADAKAADQNIGNHHGVAGSTSTTQSSHVSGSTTSSGAHSGAPGNIGVDRREPVSGTAVQEEPGINQRF